MKRFRFSLETVLKVKRGREERVQLEFSAAQERRARELIELGRLERALEGINNDRAGTREKGGLVVLADEKIYEAARKARIGWISRQRYILAEAETAMEAKRLELVEASKERKVLEKLEESQYRDFLVKLNREEQAFMDELASHSSANRNG